MNIIEAIRGLPNLLALKPASTKDITDASIQLRLEFSDEYTEYLTNFGAIMADGIELTGIAKSAHRNVVTVTKKNWALNAKVPHDLYVIEDTGIDGIVIWQSKAGTVYQTAPTKEPLVIEKSLNDYLSSREKG